MSVLIKRFIVDYYSGKKENLEKYLNWGSKALYFEQEDVFVIPIETYEMGRSNIEMIQHLAAKKITNFNDYISSFKKSSEEKTYLAFGLWLEISNKKNAVLFKNIKLGDIPVSRNYEYSPLMHVDSSGKIKLNVLYTCDSELQKIFNLNLSIGRLSNYHITIKHGSNEIKLATPLINLSIDKENKTVKLELKINSNLRCIALKEAAHVMPINNIPGNQRKKIKEMKLCSKIIGASFFSKKDKISLSYLDFLTLPNCFIPNSFFIHENKFNIKAGILFHLNTMKYSWFDLKPYLPLMKDLYDLGLCFFSEKKVGKYFIGGFLLMANYANCKRPLYIRESMSSRLEIVCCPKDFEILSKTDISKEFRSYCKNYRFFLSNKEHSAEDIAKKIKIRLKNTEIVLIKESWSVNPLLIKDNQDRHLLIVVNGHSFLPNVVNAVFKSYISKIMKNVKYIGNIDVLKDEKSLFFAILGKIRKWNLEEESYHKIIWLHERINIVRKKIEFRNVEELLKELVESYDNAKFI